MTASHDPRVPTSPFSPIVPLFLEPADSELLAFLKEVLALAQAAPGLLAAIDKDLDAHALRKKADRVADEKWYANQTLVLPGTPEPAK